MAGGYMKRNVLFLKSMLPDDTFKHGFTYPLSAFSSKRWKYLYSAREKNMIMSTLEIATDENRNG